MLLVVVSTQSQTDANRRNSQKSTGPRSVEGKAASSMNALQTGINAKREIIRGESAEELQALSDRYYQRWAPTTPEQSYLVDVLISSDWITRRLRRVEAELWTHQIKEAWTPDKNTPLAQAFSTATGTFDSLTRRIESTVRMNRKALEALIKMEALIKLKAAAPPAPALNSVPAPEADPEPDPEPVGPEPPRVPPAEPPQNQPDRPAIGFVLPIRVDSRRPAQPMAPPMPPPASLGELPDCEPGVHRQHAAHPKIEATKHHTLESGDAQLSVRKSHSKRPTLLCPPRWPDNGNSR
jgi:hypothetical protein